MTTEPPYEQSKAFFLAFGPMLYGEDWVRFVPKALEENERRGTKIAQKGMRMAVADLIEDSARLPFKKVEEIDASLRSLNAPTLSEMRAASTSFVRGLLRKAKISTEDEFLTIRSIVESGLIYDKE